MPQCKLANCRLEAVPGGKRYCPEHLARYHARKREYERVKATLPLCACGCRLTKTQADRGDIMCASCWDAFERQKVLDQEAEKRAARRSLRHDELMRCHTVEDLQRFIWKYLLPE